MNTKRRILHIVLLMVLMLVQSVGVICQTSYTASDILGTSIGGTVTILEDGPYLAGDAVLLIASPESCAKEEGIIQWSDGQAEGQSARNYIIPNTPEPIYAIFQLKKYNLNTDTQGHGYIIVDGVTSSDFENSLTCGEDIEIKAIANDGYIFVGWEDAEPEHSTGNISTTDNPRTFTNVQGNISILPIFKKAVTISVAFEDETGTITITDEDNNPIISGDKVPEGTILHITATSTDDCYEFKTWSNGSTDNPLIISADESIDLTTSFDIKQYTITTASNNAEHGTTEAIEL